MDDNKKKGLDIDPFQFPTDKSIKKSSKNWQAAKDKPCRSEAIKWLQCMDIVKEYYQLQGRDVNDGMAWHKFMLDKCWVTYSGYNECSLDAREAKMKKMRQTLGEERWKESEDQVKDYLSSKLGQERATQIWEYQKGHAQRFKELRKSVDEERGVIRNDMEIPDYESGIASSSSPNKDSTTEETPAKPKSGFKGWWSEPESRFKK